MCVPTLVQLQVDNDVILQLSLIQVVGIYKRVTLRSAIISQQWWIVDLVNSSKQWKLVAVITWKSSTSAEHFEGKEIKTQQF